MRKETAIVVAAYDDTYAHLTKKLAGGPVEVVSTASGGHPTGAYLDFFRYGPKYESYLFLQDSLDAQVEDVVAPFKQKQLQVSRGGRWPEIVAWGFFPMFFDNEEQRMKVQRKYPVLPPVGIFGPIFYAERGALEMLERFYMLPERPVTKMDAQGSERAWAAAFFSAHIAMASLGKCVNDGESPILFPEDTTFVKVFGGRK